MNTYGCVKKYCIFEISKLHTCIHIEECVIFVQFWHSFVINPKRMVLYRGDLNNKSGTLSLSDSSFKSFIEECVVSSTNADFS